MEQEINSMERERKLEENKSISWRKIERRVKYMEINGGDRTKGKKWEMIYGDNFKENDNERDIQTIGRKVEKELFRRKHEERGGIK